MGRSGRLLGGGHARTSVADSERVPLGWAEEASVVGWIRARNINTGKRLIAAFTSVKTQKTLAPFWTPEASGKPCGVDHYQRELF